MSIFQQSKFCIFMIKNVDYCFLLIFFSLKPLLMYLLSFSIVILKIDFNFQRPCNLNRHLFFQAYLNQPSHFDKSTSLQIILTLMSILDKLTSKHHFWSLPSSRLPPNLREYKCELVIDELKVDAGQRAECVYLRFTHPLTGSTFQIIIDQVKTPCSSIYEAEINIDDIESPKTTLIQPFDSICFTTVRNYQKPEMIIKEIEFRQDSPYHSDEQICNYFDFDSGAYYSDDDEVSLIDYAPQNQKEVKYKVLMFLKNPANRFKKMKEIKAFLKKLKYNVPDNHLKNIITSYCGSHIMDKKRGFLVHEDYLSLEEKQIRKKQQEQLQKKEKEKEAKKTERKKTAKKQTKGEKPGKKTVQITSEDLHEYAKSEKCKQTKAALGILTKQSKKPKK